MVERDAPSNAALIDRLADADGEAVRETIDELGRRNAVEAAPRLLEVLRTTEDTPVRNAAALALSDMGIPEAFDAITELLSDPRTERSRGTLLYALDPYDNGPNLELLVHLAITGNWEVSRSAYGLITGIATDIGEDLWRRLRARLESAAETAGDERRTEVILPLLDRFGT
jgi:HEAT repeat protein